MTKAPLFENRELLGLATLQIVARGGRREMRASGRALVVFAEDARGSDVRALLDAPILPVPGTDRTPSELVCSPMPLATLRRLLATSDGAEALCATLDAGDVRVVGAIVLDGFAAVIAHRGESDECVMITARPVPRDARELS